MSGLFVLIGFKGPRPSAGATRFLLDGSISMGAPGMQNRKQGLSSFPRATAPTDCNAASLDRDNPIAPSVPICKKSRRVRPSQVVIDPLPESFSIIEGNSVEVQNSCFHG